MMRIFQALARPQIRWLWGGQVFSAVGDEVYNIALVWYAASLLGTAAGYLLAFFQPAMTAFLTQLIDEPALLQVTSGLMETTSRIARVIGPGLIGVLSRFVPLIHYSTIDALSFFAAAAWMFIFPLGLTLFLREKLSADVGALGFLIAGYGIGNLSSNLALAYFSFHRPERWMFAGRIVAGLGFIVLSQCSTLGPMMLAAGLAAMGGPMTDLGFVILVQKYFRGRDIARVFRYTLAIAYSALLVVFLVSPSLFAHFSVAAVLLANAILIVATGACRLCDQDSLATRADAATLLQKVPGTVYLLAGGTSGPVATLPSIALMMRASWP